MADAKASVEQLANEAAEAKKAVAELHIQLAGQQAQAAAAAAAAIHQVDAKLSIGRKGDNVLRAKAVDQMSM